MKKVLLLNPPGTHIYIRDLFCSKTSKTLWLNHPVDLVMQSGILSEHFSVSVIDAIACGLSPAACTAQIIALQPDAIVWLTGVVSYNEDFPFVAALKKNITFVSIAMGDYFFNKGKNILATHPFIDAISFDYTTDDIARYLRGIRDTLGNITYRLDDGTIIETPVMRSRGNEYSLPIPRHDLFISDNYIFPFMRRHPFATVMTDFGCPFHCQFCIMSTLGYKYRPIPNIIDELRAVKRCGGKEIFFADQTWGARKDRAHALCQAMIAEKFNFGWICFSRVDVIDEPLIRAMKAAGCHTIIFGVESGNDSILKQYRKGYTTDQIANAFILARRNGIETVGTFLIGLPEETEETFNTTMKFALTIPCDYFSFNIAVPRPGTGLREHAIADGLITQEHADQPMDQAGSVIAMPTHALTPAQVRALLQRGLLHFYFRPSYLLRRIMSIGSWYHLRISLMQAIELVKRIAGMR